MEPNERAAVFYETLAKKAFYAAAEIHVASRTVAVFHSKGFPIVRDEMPLEAFIADLREKAITDSGRMLAMTAADYETICRAGLTRDFCVCLEERPNIMRRFLFTLYGMPSDGVVLLTAAPVAEPDDVITILIKKNPETFKSDRILFVDYGNHSVEMHCTDRVSRFFSVSFSDVAEMLLMHRNFIRSYKNCIVNMDKVKGLEHDAFVMWSGDVISIPKRRLKEIRTAYEDYLALTKLYGPELR